MYHDTHMHLDLYKNRREVIDYIENIKQYTIAVTNLPSLYEKYIKEYGELQYVRFALGYHPELVSQYINQKCIFFDNLHSARYIGEIGLDFNQQTEKTWTIQVDIFKQIVAEASKYGNKILSVHSRNSSERVVDILKEFNGGVILHWYTGDYISLEIAISKNFYFSVNQNMVSTETGKAIIKKIPLDRILIESDAPFTRGLQHNYSNNYREPIMNCLSILHGKSHIELKENLYNNFKRLLETYK